MKKRFSKIYIEITNICNLNCSFCLEDSREKKMMNAHEFRNIITKIKEYTNLVTFHVKGEPLLHKDLEELLGICHENNVFVNITTNGSLLYKNIEILKKAKSLRQLNISIHSIYDKNVLLGIDDTDAFQNDYMLNIFDCVDNITKENDIYISYRLWNLASREEKLKNTNVLKMISNKYDIADLENKILEKDGVKLKEKVYLNQDISFIWPSLDNDTISDKGSCHGLKNQIAILSNGDVVPCCLDQDAKILLGNIFVNTLEEILDTKKCKDIITGFNTNSLVEELCQKCDYIKKFQKHTSCK